MPWRLPAAALLALSIGALVSKGEASCPPALADGCSASFGKAKLALRKGTAGEKLSLRARRGSTAPRFFGDPTGGEPHATCLYDGTGALALELVVGGGPFWSVKGDRNLYRDRTGAAGGVTRIVERSGAKARFAVTAKGPSLSLPALPLAPPLVAQQRVVGGACGEVRFDALRVNEPDRLRASASTGSKCAGSVAPPLPTGAFSEPRPVAIQGYAGDAMEPALSRDGRYLLFNDRNDPAVDTDLHYAERVDDLTFQYRGELQGANSTALDAVAALDAAETLYFVSTRSYAQTLSSLYQARFAEGAVTNVELVEGLSRQMPGHVNFDVEVSTDGGTLYFVDGIVSGGPVPDAADLAIAERYGAGFRRSARSVEILRHVNTESLEYAAAISRDSRELFFTRLAALPPQIYRATRACPEEAFGPPEKIAVIEGVAEAPTLSADEGALYYHKLEGARFAIYRVAR